ncbi:hypothetical protein E2562_018658 [Oryza meyeriana var. granulata]|uniref:Uncharacterized protein n=1 Tax=Oryza meyeriana var. granulata TaxID=110450 RepID=A0A6G1BX26_9ORYZ|nr:hypothetical protein E2562_018658 [Oryza meyeriana var. granulata]
MSASSTELTPLPTGEWKPSIFSDSRLKALVKEGVLPAKELIGCGRVQVLCLYPDVCWRTLRAQREILLVDPSSDESVGYGDN